METFSAKTLRGRLLVFLKGMAMGVADSVPGVSGGTIAVMAGVYEELIHSLKNLNPFALWDYRKRGVAGFWQSINGSFLLALLLGIVTALFLSANTVLYLLETHYPQLMAFFCGLVLASTFFLRRQVLRWALLEGVFLVMGIILTLVIAFINPMAGQTGYIYLFLCGAIAICAMILPGISGAFILLLLGVYDYVLTALRALDVGIIVVFAAGCATGLLSFSHVLSWTFKHYREQTYAFLTGMLLASIVVLWPWKLAPEHGATGASYLSPNAYAAVTGSSVSVLSVVVLFILGFALVTIFERISSSRA